MDLFDMQQTNTLPLAARMRPKTIDEIVGQQHILGKDKLLYRAIVADQLQSIILYGPPGTGKTTIAMVIANHTKSHFQQVNATTSGKKELEEIVKNAKQNYALYRKKTILFIDEIHRFNSSQQDYLLPFVEDGTFVLIGATTENPYFEVNSALLSRSQIFELRPLTSQDIEQLLRRAIEDSTNGVGQYMPQVDGEAIHFLAEYASGDGRSALKGLELAVLTTDKQDDGYRHITLAIAQECIQKKALRYDKNGDQHYDVISAFIKSMRGSDPDATIYYLARMLVAGEDVKFIARRIMIAAAEECGNSDPRALEIATSAALAVERIGMPEGAIVLANAATYVACAPKSNASSQAIFEAMDLVNKTGNLPIPPYLKDAHYAGAKQLERGIGYQYAHDYPNHYVKQQYLPDEIKDHHFYHFSNIAYEAKLQKYFELIGKPFSKEKK